MIIIIIYLFRTFSTSTLLLALVVNIGAIQLGTAQSDGPQRRFEADIVVGSNFSQLDGDGIAGFNKVGIKAGLDISYPTSETKGWSLGLYLDQRGSSTRLIRTNVFDQFIALQYLSIPISIYSKSWWHDETNRYKVKVYGSFVPARLFASSSDNPSFDNETDSFKKWDMSFLIGISYGIGPRASLRISAERSVLKIYRIPNSSETGLQSYQLNFSYAYNLN